MEELPGEYSGLAEAALLATADAYAPYSEFRVGAAVLLENGSVVTGSNQENAAYPSGLCAERVALFSACTQYPGVKVLAIAIAAMKDGRQVGMISPCGGCRQVMQEIENRYGQKITVLLYGAERLFVIEDAASLLPVSFTL